MVCEESVHEDYNDFSTSDSLTVCVCVFFIHAVCTVQESAGHDSDSGSTSSHYSNSTKSSSGSFKSNSVAAQGEDIEVKVDPSSCTDSDSSYWEADMPVIKNTEEMGQNKGNGGHQNANGKLFSSAASPAGQLPRRDKKRKMKDISESGSQIYRRKDGQKKESSSSETPSSRKLAQHECVFCGKRFRDRYHLARHLSVHSGETAPDCELCKTPRNCCACVQHSPQYSLIKQHKCDICNKMFRDKYHLNRHFLVHTKEKPYQCEVCQKLFSRKDKLMQHSLLHD